jgi:hypothetical protein
MNRLAPIATNDATPEGLAALRKSNEAFRKIAWPAPFATTLFIEKKALSR